MMSRFDLLILLNMCCLLLRVNYLAGKYHPDHQLVDDPGRVLTRSFKKYNDRWIGFSSLLLLRERDSQTG